MNFARGDTGTMDRRWKTWDERYLAARRAGCSREESATKAELYMMRIIKEDGINERPTK